ncbi:MAG: YggS family pyridoxal phosphate-dependent enzyme [Ilumatobacter sp.]
MTHDVDAVIARLAALRDRIDAVDRTWTHAVEIVAVTKAFDPSIIDVAVRSGCAAIGENYAQDLLSKRDAIEQIAPESRPRIDFIGHLQSNKVRQLAGLVDRWCTVDRISLAREIARRDPGAEVLVQVNATGEADKSGCVPSDVAELARACTDSGLRVGGLLTIGPTNEPVEAARSGFREVRELVDAMGLAVCSMGMTGDLEVGVACGASSVRVGSALFGPRPVHQQPHGRG